MNPSAPQGPAVETDSRLLTQRERLVLAQLETALGLENAVPQADLASRTGLSKREVGALVKSLIENRNLPLGSSTGGKHGRHGYFWITVMTEQKASEEQIVHRIGSLARRLACLRRATPADVLKELSGQLAIAFVEE